jgi:hypothetical protein
MGCLLYAERLDSADELGLIEAGRGAGDQRNKKVAISLTRNLYDDVLENVANYTSWIQ